MNWFTRLLEKLFGPQTSPPPAEVPRTGPGLGRRFAADARDASHPMRSLLPARASTRKYRYWSNTGWWGDQGYTSQCVAFAWLHLLEDGPVGQTFRKPPCEDPSRVYAEAQKVDEWPGENYEGTSVRAGAKVLAHLGYMTEYRWAASIDDIVQHLLERGPVVVGTNWYESMFDPDPKTGLMKISGRIVGGHAYVLNGVNVKTGLIRIKNSWGRGWGLKGSAWQPISMVARLLSEQGEACVATEVTRPGKGQ